MAVGPFAARAWPRDVLGTPLALMGIPGRGGAPLVHSSPFAPPPFRDPSPLLDRRTDSDRRRCEAHDAPEQRIVFGARLRPEPARCSVSSRSISLTAAGWRMRSRRKR